MFAEIAGMSRRDFLGFQVQAVITEGSGSAEFVHRRASGQSDDDGVHGVVAVVVAILFTAFSQQIVQAPGAAQ